MAEPEPESVENPVPAEPTSGPPPDDVVVPDHKSDDASYIADPYTPSSASMPPVLRLLRSGLLLDSLFGSLAATSCLP